MKALHIRKDRSLALQNDPAPQPPGPEEVLVRMAYASICGYEIMILRGKAAIPPNGILGHEGSGVVAAVGSAVTELRPGDPVAILPYLSCGVCDACRSNRSEYCMNSAQTVSLMQEYVLVDRRQLFRLPEGLTLKEASLIEPLMMAMHAVRKANLRYGSNVLLLGCGAMGQIILKLVREYPVGKIVAVDPNAEKRATALRFGADVAMNPYAGNLVSEALMLTGGFGYDAVLEISGSRESARRAFQLVARGGSVVYFGLYGMDFNLEVNLMSLYWKDATLSAVAVPSGCFPDALRMARHLRLAEVITGLYPFDQAVEAYQEKARGGHAKVMLEFSREERI